MGYGLGGLLGVLAGGALITRLGYEGLFIAAAVLALLAAVCAWRMEALERTGDERQVA
jgi:PPP family 3-phenylpropionic acid transporter